MNNTPLPQNPDSERAAITCTLQNPENRSDTLKSLHNQHFHSPTNRIIWSAIEELKDLADPTTIQELLLNRNLLQDVGGPSTILELYSNPVATAHLPHYVSQIKDAYHRRQTILSASEITKAAQNPNVDFLQIAKSELTHLTHLTSKKPNHLTSKNPQDIMNANLPAIKSYFADSVIAPGDFTTILGQGGIGKSRIATQLAVCCILGIPFCGQHTNAKGLPWFILQAENSTRRLQQDLQNIKNWISEAQWQELIPLLHFHTLDSELDHNLALTSDTTRNIIANTIDHIKPHFVLWDALPDFAIGNLNSDEDMHATIQAIIELTKYKDTSRTPLAIHHSQAGKAGQEKITGFDRVAFGRNSKRLYNRSRGQINIAPANPDNNRELIFACGKNNDGPEFKPYGIILTENMIYEENPDFSLDAWEDAKSSPKSSQHSWDVADIVNQLHEPMLTKPFQIKCAEEAGISKATFYRLLKKAEDNTSLWKSPLDNTWWKKSSAEPKPTEEDKNPF